MLQALLFAQFWIADNQREADQQHRQTYTSNAKQSLHMAICLHDCIAFQGPDRIGRSESKRVGIDSSCKGGVAGLPLELPWYDLLPHGTGNGVPECASDVVGCEVYTSDDGDV
jgi:hypothetical protein